MSSAPVYKVLGPVATVVVGGFIGVQNYLYRAGVKDDMKELKEDLKKDIKDVKDNANEKHSKLKTEISNINGNKRIDSLEASKLNLENKVECLNTKLEKLDLKIDKAEMEKGASQILSPI